MSPVTTSDIVAPRRRIDAIDGLRGLALLGMLGWHAQVGWIKGGFARMTIFFALSGFLAATSFLALRRRGEPRPFRTFWWRRARRLLPVSLLGVALAMGVSLFLGGAVGATMRGDALSVLTYASNWRFIAADQAYGALFERPSAFQHFWSLSVEEQCFWLLPIVLAGAALLTRRWAWAAVAIAAAGLAAIPFFIPHSPDAAYYGTHVRAGELLAGVALALGLHHHRGQVPAPARPLVRWIGAGSLALLLVVMATVDRELPWLYRGGLGLFALPAVAVVAAALDQRGPVPWVLSRGPLVRLGQWAFPIYVLHWPIFLVMTPERVGVAGAPLVVLQLAVSIALGALVHHHLEKPLMVAGRGGPATGAQGTPALGTEVPARRWHDRWSRDGVAVGALAGLTAVLVVAAVVAPQPAPVYDFAADEDRANEWVVDPAGQQGTAVGLFGGSTAVMLGAAAWDWTPASEVVRAVPGSSRLGCGLLTEGERVYARDARTGAVSAAAPDDDCVDWEQRWPSAVADNGVEMALVMAGVWDTADWRLPGAGDDRWRSIVDPEVEERVRSGLERAVDLLNEQGAYVVLATTPLVGTGEQGTSRADRGLDTDHEDRVGRFNALVHQVADARPLASVVDYGAFVDQLGPARSADWLRDGIHPTAGAAAQIWVDFLGPELEALAHRWAELRGLVPLPDAPPGTEVAA